MGERVPDYPEPIRAFRVWRLDLRVRAEALARDGTGRVRLLRSDLPPLLRSRNGLFVWRPGKNVAECRWFEYGPPSWPEKGPPAEQHEAPQRECGCGFYGAFAPPPPKLWSYWDEGGCHVVVHLYVRGLMEAWGRVIEHEGGLRAQYARVLALTDPSAVLGLQGGDAESVAELVRETASAYGAAYVTDLASLEALRLQGLRWFREHRGEVQPEPTPAAGGRVRLLPESGPADPGSWRESGFRREEEE